MDERRLWRQNDICEVAKLLLLLLLQ